MRLQRLVVIGLALSLATPLALALAQQTTKKDGKAAKTEQKSAAQGPQSKPEQSAPQPSDEIKKLARHFVGRWKVTGKVLDENWIPGGAEGSGMEVARRGPGGFSVISDSRMDFGKMGPFAGHGVTYWDASKKAYSGFWCDAWGPTCEPVGEGKWEGDKLVFTAEMKMGDQTIPTRQTYSNITRQGFDWLMESGDGKGGWKPSMSMKYERAQRGGRGMGMGHGAASDKKPAESAPKQ
ncbi:MAG TPA: DUF1579 family protein [Clostridia bacterium]|nr:DUF1579 family protein [Clostridia bacterium]